MTSKWNTMAGTMMAALGMLMMTGCSAMNMQESGFQPGGSVSGASLQGILHGGNLPIVGANIQLYQVGTSGYGSAAVPLLTKTVTTGPGGSFNISSDYSCSSGTYVYITATGGNPGLGQTSLQSSPTTPVTVNNTNSAMMVALGDCGNLSSSTNIWINEVTTVAAVAALHQFISIVPGTTLAAQPGTNPVTAGTPPAFSIGSSSGNTQGLANAFGIAALLATNSTGKSPGAYSAAYTGPGTSANRVLNVESYHINTMANVLAACVNTDPNSLNSDYSGTCSALEGAVVPSGTAPADTLQIAYDMQQNPTYNVSTVLGYATPSSPFQPSDSDAADWTVGYQVQYSYKANGTDPSLLNTVVNFQFDKFGNAWAVNSGHSTGHIASFISEFDGTGNYVTEYTSYNTGKDSSPTTVAFPIAPSYSTNLGLAIDPTGNVFTVDDVNSAIIEIPAASAAGAAGGNAYGLSLGSSNAPTGIVSDGNGTIYIGQAGATTPTSTTAFGTNNIKGLATFVPSLASGGPLTAGSGSTVSTTLNTAYYSLAVSQDLSTNYGGGGFLYVAGNSSALCTGSYATDLGMYFTRAAMVGSVTTTPGEVSPVSAVINAATSGTCSSAYSQIPTQTISWNGSNYTVPGLFPVAQSVAIDGGDNIWVLNAANSENGTGALAGFPQYYLSQLKPTYSTNGTTGALQASYTASIFTAPMLQGTSYPSGGTAPAAQFIASRVAIDGANNAWLLSGSGPGTFTAFNSSSSTPLSGNNGSLYTFSGTTKTCAGFCGGINGSSYRAASWNTSSAFGIDLAGNVWETNSNTGGYSIYIVVGVAAPTIAPLSAQVANHSAGTRP